MTWAASTAKWPIVVLFSRSLLFLFFQAMIAWAVGSWSGSVRFWMLIASLTNIVSIIMLMLLLKSEGTSYTALFRTSWGEWKRNAFLFMGLAVLSIMLVLLPNALLNNWIYGNDGHYQELLFQPVPNGLRLILLFAFPITTGAAELATYFGYVMPRLERRFPSRYTFLLPVLFLSVQHCFLPFVPELKFMVYRSSVYLPFALVLGVALRRSPSLLPYLSVLHIALDGMAALMMFHAIQG